MADQDTLYNLEKSFDIQINLGKFVDDDLNNQIEQINQPFQQFDLLESFPISFNGQLSQSNGAMMNENAKSNQTQEQDNYNILESIPIQVNFQKVHDIQYSNQFEKDVAITNTINSNVSTTADEKEKKYEMQLKNQMEFIQLNNQNNQKKGESTFQNSLTLPKYQNNQNQQLTSSAGVVKNIQKTQPLANTQVINEKQKSDSSDDENIPVQSFDPDIISNTNLKKQKQYVQHFQLKLQNQNGNLKPQQVLENDGKDKVIIGRGSKDNRVDIQINDWQSSISGKHAMIVWRHLKQTWCLSDEGSTNGTYLIINNAAIKTGDEIIIGLHLAKIVKITKSFPIEISIEFENIVDDIPPFTINGKVDLNNKFILGRKHQTKEFENDPLIQDDHCYIFFDNKKLKIQNCDNVFYKTAKKLDKTKQVELNANSIIRFGFFNQYTFTPYSKPIENLENTPITQQPDTIQSPQCKSCKITNSKFYKLTPCNHDQLCIICAHSQKCPICGKKVDDFY